jgi:hypothetical protein
VSDIGKNCVILATKKIIANLNKKLRIKVVINNKAFERLIDLKKGNFIGISHWPVNKEREFVIYQQFGIFWHE